MFRTTRSKILTAALSVVAFGTVAVVPFASAQDNTMTPHNTPAMSDSTTMKPSKDIIETATGPGMAQVTTVVAAIKAAGLVDTLQGAGPFTVFAPTNAAFDKLPKGTVEELLKPENKEKLKAILL